MKRFVLLCGLSAILLASCSTMKKDCQGRKHKRLENGIYI